MLIAEFQDLDIDESGKIARVDFYSWYGLDDLDSLDEEYAKVREIYGLTQLEDAVKPKSCLEGQTELKDKDTGLNWNFNFNEQKFNCKDTIY